MANGKIELKVSADDEDTAYLSLPDFPAPSFSGVVASTTRLKNIHQYAGPDIFLDFDKDGRLIGIEILA